MENNITALPVSEFDELEELQELYVHQDLSQSEEIPYYMSCNVKKGPLRHVTRDINVIYLVKKKSNKYTINYDGVQRGFVIL